MGYNSRKDLQEHMDIGLRFSKDSNPLSPPCIPPNPGFRDLSAKSNFLAVQIFELEDCHLYVMTQRL
jgi:hypothetical protein